MKDDNLRIIGIDITDVKRVKAFRCQIDPERGLITIGGENAQGKSSVLDAVESCLGSPGKEMKDPVRHGADKGTSRILVGGAEVEYRIEREFTPGKPPKLIVKSATGKEVENASSVLKALLNEMPINPIDFLNAQPKEQRLQLVKLSGIDIDAHDIAIRQALDEEKRLEREKIAAEGKAEGLVWHKDAPSEPLSVSDIANEIAAADKANGAKQLLESDLERIIRDSVSIENQVKTHHATIARLTSELNAAKDALSASVMEVTELSQARTAAQKSVEDFQLIDVEPLRAKLLNTDELNSKYRANQVKLESKEKWEQAEAAFLAQIEKRKSAEAAKRKALSEAQFPVEGLGFDDSGVTYLGVPLQQASKAEQFRCSVGIAIANKGRLAPILIRDASIMDANTLSILEGIAIEHGVQIFAEIVANRTDDGFDRDCIFYVEDGEQWTPPTEGGN